MNKFIFIYNVCNNNYLLALQGSNSDDMYVVRVKSTIYIDVCIHPIAAMCWLIERKKSTLATIKPSIYTKTHKSLLFITLDNTTITVLIVQSQTLIFNRRVLISQWFLHRSICHKEKPIHDNIWKPHNLD